MDELRPRLPKGFMLSLARDAALGRRRDFGADCRTLLDAFRYPVRVEGAECIPMDGPVVLVANHLQGPHLWVGWAGALITAAVAGQTGEVAHWAVNVDVRGETARLGMRLAPFKRWLFNRAAANWDHAAVDPRRPGATARALIRHVESGRTVAIFPEGAVQGIEGLFEPQPGAMRLIDRLGNRGAIVPAAVRIEDGGLTCAFGAPAHSAEAAWASIRNLFEGGQDRAAVLASAAS